MQAGSAEAIAFATGAFALASVSLYALPVFADHVAADFTLSSSQVGLLTSALAVSYAAMQVPAGVIGDAIGINRAFAIGLALCAVGFLGSALAESFSLLLVLRALTGAGAGMLLPLASALAAAVDQAENTRGQAFMGSGSGFGYIFSLLVLMLVFSTWEAAFVALGCLAGAAALYALAWLPAARRPGSALRAALAGLGRTSTWLLGAYLFGLTVALVGIAAWFSEYGQADRGLSETAAGGLASLIGFGLLASIAGAPATRRVGEGRVMLASTAIATLAVVLIAAPLGTPALAAGLFLLGWGSGFPYGVVLALAPRLVEGGAARAQGAIAGAVNGVAFLAAIVTPPLVGLARDQTGSFTLGFWLLLVGPIFALAAAGPALSRVPGCPRAVRPS